jgi:hypothetical protein
LVKKLVKQARKMGLKFDVGF